MGSFLNLKRRLCATAELALAASVLLSGCGQAGARPGRIEPADAATRRTVPFSQMEIGPADGDALAEELRALAERVDEAESLDQLLEWEEALNDHSEQFYTSSSLAQLATYLNTSDEQARERNEVFSSQSEEVSSAAVEYLRAVLESDLADEYLKDAGPYVAEVMQTQVKTNDPAALEYLQKRTELDNEYNDKLSNLRVTINGEEWRMQDVLVSEELTPEQVVQALADYYLGNYREFGELYLEMIALDKKAAAACGYDDAAEWRYDQFGRDYSPDDALELCEEIKRELVDLNAAVMYDGTVELEVELEDGEAAVSGVVSEADPLLAECWQFMQKNELFSFAPSAEKMSGIGFTTTLSAYNAPFVYTYWSGGLSDAYTMLHEFGHACDEYAQFGNEAYQQDLDKCETFSQGLEQVLSAPLAEALGADPAEVRRSQLVDLTSVLVYQAALEEFQLRAYELDASATPEDLCFLYADVLSDYGYPSIFGQADPTWFEVTHLFDAPFYTISYVTSATAALELGRMEQEQEGAGLAAWLQLLHTDRNQSFEDFLESAGIASPFEKGRIAACADFLAGELENQLAAAA